MEQIFLCGKNKMIGYMVEHIAIVKIDFVITNISIAYIGGSIADFIRGNNTTIPRGFGFARCVMWWPVGGVDS